MLCHAIVCQKSFFLVDLWNLLMPSSAWNRYLVYFIPVAISWLSFFLWISEFLFCFLQTAHKHYTQICVASNASQTWTYPLSIRTCPENMRRFEDWAKHFLLFQYVFKVSSRRVCKMFSWRPLEKVLQTNLEDVLKICFFYPI